MLITSLSPEQTLALLPAVQRLNIHCYTYPELLAYANDFGIPAAGAPFGVSVWQGIAAHFQRWVLSGCWTRGGPHAFLPGPFAVGWFYPPVPFGRAAAALDLDVVPYDEPYPAVFWLCSSGDVYMWCLHIVIQRSRYWRVHRNRVRIMQERAAIIHNALGLP